MCPSRRELSFRPNGRHSGEVKLGVVDMEPEQARNDKASCFLERPAGHHVIREIDGEGAYFVGGK